MKLLDEIQLTCILARLTLGFYGTQIFVHLFYN